MAGEEDSMSPEELQILKAARIVAKEVKKELKDEFMDKFDALATSTERMRQKQASLKQDQSILAGSRGRGRGRGRKDYRIQSPDGFPLPLRRSARGKEGSTASTPSSQSVCLDVVPTTVSPELNRSSEADSETLQGLNGFVRHFLKNNPDLSLSVSDAMISSSSGSKKKRKAPGVPKDEQRKMLMKSND